MEIDPEVHATGERKVYEPESHWYTLNHTSHNDDKFYENFTIYHNATGIMEVTTLATSALFVAGVFFNITAIGVFGCSPFNRMSFTIYMKIICCFNIAVLFLGMIQHHSFILDLQPDADTGERKKLCVQILWFILVLEHSRAFSIALVIYNRIKAQRTPDAHNKSLIALRIPVLTNATMMLLCTVPVSSYVEEYIDATSFYNRSECVFAFLKPYNTAHFTGLLMSNMALLEETVNVSLICILMLEIMLKHWRLRRALAREKMNARASASDQLLSVMMALKRSYPKGGSTATKETDEMHNYVAMVIFHLLTSGPRRLQHTPVINEYIPEVMVRSFNLLAVLDIIQYCYMAVMFAVLCASSSLYRSEAYKMIFEMNIDSAQSDASLANAARVMNTLLRRGSHEAHRVKSKSMSTVSKEYGAVIESFELDKNALMLLTTDDHRPLPVMQTSVEVLEGRTQYTLDNMFSDTDLDYARQKAFREKKLKEMLSERHTFRQQERSASREKKRREMITEIQKKSSTTVKNDE
ncbi:uncharacterized protein LOC106053012 isoform X2 [Biomphalaria glabrata]|uniref:Uncharacterized protein LOC106053012 isoform X2 n=1 Tax=Biomphalaria glabrata TaxID=6526 RepID=A0A9W3B039_BIOGL|nr:uncharacterized protein LOC106053012 isoform X2 [Biomphalaria glabrata]